MDINGGQGMSGGPVFDAQHRVIGIMSLITNPKNLRRFVRVRHSRNRHLPAPGALTR
jgi:S1-C subfamily serine protease